MPTFSALDALWEEVHLFLCSPSLVWALAHSSSVSANNNTALHIFLPTTLPCGYLNRADTLCVSARFFQEHLLADCAAQLWFRAESLRSVFTVEALRQAKCAVSLSFDCIMIIQGKGLAVPWRCGMSVALMHSWLGKQIPTCEKCLVFLGQLGWLHTRQADMAWVHCRSVGTKVSVGLRTTFTWSWSSLGLNTLWSCVVKSRSDCLGLTLSLLIVSFQSKMSTGISIRIPKVIDSI